MVTLIEKLEIKTKELEGLLIKNYENLSEKDIEKTISVTGWSKSRIENFRLKQEVEKLEQKVKELEKYEEQIENLEQNVVEILTKVKEKEDQEITY